MNDEKNKVDRTLRIATILLTLVSVWMLFSALSEEPIVRYHRSHHRSPAVYSGSRQVNPHTNYMALRWVVCSASVALIW